jgi:two-component system NtrC family sensor kinase
MDYVAFLIIAPVASVFIIITFFTIWPFRHEPITPPLLWFLGSIALLLVSNVLEMIAPTTELTLVLRKTQHIFYHTFSISWFVFALSYAGLQKQVLKLPFLIYLLIPLASLIVVFTNELHRLFWTEITYVQIFGMLTMQVSYGPLFWVTIIVIFLLLIVGVFTIIGVNINGPALYRKQGRWMIAGVLIPLVFNFSYIFNLIPGQQKDFSPVAFAISGIFFYFGIYKHRLLKILPQSRANIIQALKEGVIVLDLDLKIIDFNLAAQKLFNINDDYLGRSIAELPAGDLYLKTSLGTTERTHIIFYNDLWLQVKEQFFTDSTYQTLGQVLIIEDVTEQHQLTQELQKVKNQLRTQETFATIGQISGSIAHEIKNPLSYVTSGYRMLKQIIENKATLLNEKDMVEIQSILSDSFGGLSIIQNVVQNMLDLSHQKKADTDQFRILDALKYSITILSSEYPFQHTIDCVENLSISGNKESFMQICLNIIRNSIQSYTRDNSTNQVIVPRFAIKAFVENHHLNVDFSNNGPPIPEDVADKIFEPLFTTKEDGSGLGLAISKNLAETFPSGTLTLTSLDPVCFRFQMKLE